MWRDAARQSRTGGLWAEGGRREGGARTGVGTALEDHGLDLDVATILDAKRGNVGGRGIDAVGADE
jgi:hypothetical protein